MQRKPLFFILIIGSIVLLLSGVLLFEAFRPRPLLVAFIDLEGRSHEALVASLDEIASKERALPKKNSLLIEEHSSFSEFFNALSRSRPFSRSPELVFGWTDIELKDNLAQLEPIAYDLSNTIPKALQAELEDGGRLRALPLLFDSLEISSNRIWDSTLGFNPGSTAWFNSLYAAKETLETKTKVGLFMQGQDNTFLSLLLSALIIENGGAASYSAICATLKEGTHPAELEKNNPIWQATLSQVRKWRKNGLLSPDWLRHNSEDEILLLEEGRIIGLIQTLSTRREMPYEQIFTFRPAPFPATRNNKRPRSKIVAPSIVGVVPNQSKRKTLAHNTLDKLSSGDSIWRLARSAGLVAASSHAKQSDLQASDAFARLEPAQSSANGLLRDAFSTKEEAEIFIQALRTLLE